MQLGIQRKIWERCDLVISAKQFFGGRGARDTINSVGLSRKHLLAGLDASLARLQLEYVDVVFAHRPDARVGVEETVRAMNALLDQGKAFYWGTSEWPVALIVEARDVAHRLKLVPPCVEQSSYSMLLRQRIEAEFLPLYPQLGVTAYSPLAGGAITDTKPELTAEAGATKIVARLQPIVARLGCTMSQLALAWTLANRNVSTAIFGASSLPQLRDNLGALDVLPRLTAAVMLEIEGALQNDPDDGADPRFGREFRLTAAPLAKTTSACAAAGRTRSPVFFNGHKAAVSLTFDDGLDVHHTNVIPILEQHGFRGTFYVNPDSDYNAAAAAAAFVKNETTRGTGQGADAATAGASGLELTKWERQVAAGLWQQAANAGHEIGNHTTSHPCSCNYGLTDPCLEDMSMADIEQTIDTAERALDTLAPGQAGRRTFCYPCYQTFVGQDATYRSYIPAVAKRFHAARGAGPGNTDWGAVPERVQLSEVWGLDVGGYTSAEMIAAVEKAVASGRWLVLVFHGVGGEHAVNVETQEFEALVEYLAATRADVWTDTFMDVAADILDVRKRLDAEVAPPARL